jgi:hypothetical protein
MMRFSPSVGRCRPVYGTNFRDAPNGLIPLNEYESGLQHAFVHDISNRTGCPSFFFSLDPGQVYRNELESRRFVVIIIIVLLLLLFCYPLQVV